MAAAQVHQQLENAVNFEGSSEEKKAKALLATLGIDYDAITMEQFINLIDVLKLCVAYASYQLHRAMK